MGQTCHLSVFDHPFRRLLCMLLAIVLAVAFVPVMPGGQSSVASAEEAASADNEAAATFDYEPGTYVEGEAVALLVSSVQNGISVQSADLLSSAQTLMDVSDEAVQDQNDAGLLSVQEEAVVQSADAGASQQLVLVRDETKTTQQLVTELQSDPRVVFAEPNFYVSINDESSVSDAAATATATATPDDVTTQSITTQDSTICPDLTAFQWGERNDGHWVGSSSAGIDIGYSAWDATAGVSDGPVIAIIDTGVDETNPDLTNKMWRSGMNYPSLVALGGDECGWTAMPDTTSTTGLTMNHGTHCAGAVAAEWNNQGTSGVSQNARIMSLAPSGMMASYIQAFNYVKTALDAGVNVKVTSNSWGMGLQGSRSISVAVTQMGQAGAMSVFASGNDSTDISRVTTNATNLAENPYAIVVNSMGPAGTLSSFSNYGVSATDVMASGSTVLSTVFSSEPTFLGEANLTDTTIYESFDSTSRFDTSIKPASGSNLFSFPSASTVTARTFEGTNSIGLAYDPVADPNGALATSGEVNLSALSVKPKYLSIRYSAILANASVPANASIALGIRCTDGSFKPLDAKDSFYMSGDGWGGCCVELPDNTDWAHFQIKISYALIDSTSIGGTLMGGKTAGTLCVDSIGLGSTRVPYMYMEGTSMACPTVAGVAAVLAQNNPNASAEKLAALVKGSTTYDSRYQNLCLTSGRAGVDASANPTATPISAISSGTTATITGYFFGSNPTVSIDGTQANVLSVTNLGDDKSSVKVTLPANFDGGDAHIRVVGTNGKTGNLFVHLNRADNLTYYDNVEMTWPDEIADWTGWQLVGFGGYIYCLPQNLTLKTYDHLLRYDPALKSWERVDIPIQGQGAYMFSAAVLQGRMYVYVESEDGDNLVKDIITLDPAGNWGQTGWSFAGCENIYNVSLSSDGTSLYTFGGKDMSKMSGPQNYDGIWKVDVNTGVFTKAGTLSIACQSPRVVYDKQKTFLVTNGQNTDSLQEGAINGMEKQVMQSDGTLAFMKARPWNLINNTGQLCFAPAVVTSGFIFAGPLSNQASGTPVADTYLLSAAEGAEPTKFDARASDKALLIPAACTYDNVLYVLADTVEAPNRVFSFTAVDTYALDIAEASIETLPDVDYTGDAFEPDVVVHFGSQILTEGIDYTLSYADNVDAGTAKVTITGMGRFTDTVSTTFNIVGKSASSDEGSQSAAGTAKTSDNVWSIGAVAALMALAGGAVALAARRRTCE